MQGIAFISVVRDTFFVWKVGERQVLQHETYFAGVNLMDATKKILEKGRKQNLLRSNF